MSQLPDAFKGHDLTGWTLGLNDPETLTYFRRMTAIGPTIIRLRFTHNTSGFQWMPECEHLNQEVLRYAGFEFEEAIKIANEWASREQFGGWAPAPIGCSADPGWQPIETAPKDGTSILAASWPGQSHGCAIVFWEESSEYSEYLGEQQIDPQHVAIMGFSMASDLLNMLKGGPDG